MTVFDVFDPFTSLIKSIVGDGGGKPLGSFKNVPAGGMTSRPKPYTTGGSAQSAGIGGKAGKYRDTSSSTGWSYANPQGRLKANVLAPQEYSKVFTQAGRMRYGDVSQNPIVQALALSAGLPSAMVPAPAATPYLGPQTVATNDDGWSERHQRALEYERTRPHPGMTGLWSDIGSPMANFLGAPQTARVIASPWSNLAYAIRGEQNPYAPSWGDIGTSALVAAGPLMKPAAVGIKGAVGKRVVERGGPAGAYWQGLRQQNFDQNPWGATLNYLRNWPNQ